MTAEPRKTRLLSPTELAELPSPRYLVQDMLRADALNVNFGPSGSGKTLLAIDHSLCIATGMAWNGQEVEKGLVIYVASEGVSGLNWRLDAWQRSRGVKTLTNFRAWPEAVNLFSGETDELIGAIDLLDQMPTR